MQKNGCCVYTIMHVTDCTRHNKHTSQLPTRYTIGVSWSCSSLGDSSLANRANVLLRKPLLDAVDMVAVATMQPPHLVICFKLLLKRTPEQKWFKHQTQDMNAGNYRGKRLRAYLTNTALLFYFC
jgi:hypothetical protein